MKHDLTYMLSNRHNVRPRYLSDSDFVLVGGVQIDVVRADTCSHG